MRHFHPANAEAIFDVEELDPEQALAVPEGPILDGIRPQLMEYESDRGHG